MHLRNFSESKRQEEAFTLFLRYLKNKKYYKAIDMLSVYTFHQLNDQRILCLALEFRIYPLINALLNIEWIDVNLTGNNNIFTGNVISLLGLQFIHVKSQVMTTYLHYISLS
jgi:hypothetical protein